jgi:short-subunit dehydrogenase
MGRFEGKVALVTGASAGIGAALARELARQGAHLVLTARRLDRLEALASELSVNGRQVLVSACDVSRDGQIEQAVSLAHERFGRIDLVIANAGFGVVGHVEKLSLDDYRRQLETNVYGVLRTVKATIADLKKTKGQLAIVGSVNGYVTLPGSSPYSMSKFAVRALSESLYYELAPSGVSVTHIAPGFVTTEIRQVDNTGRWHPGARDKVPAWIQMSAPKAARAIVRGIARRRREAVITGHGKIIVLFYRHCPWLFTKLIRIFGVQARPEP